MATRLTEKQRAFAHYFVECDNGTEAYLKAYNGNKMSRPSAARRAVALLKLAKVVSLIEDLRAERLAEMKKEAEARGATPAQIVKELSYIGLADPADFMDSEGNPRPVWQLPEHARRTLKSWNVKTGRYQCYDKPQALKQLADIFGMNKQVHEHRFSAEDMTDEELLAELDKVRGDRTRTAAARQALMDKERQDDQQLN